MRGAHGCHSSEMPSAQSGLERVLERLSTTGNLHFAVTIAAPVVPAARVFLDAPGEPAFLWAPSPQSCEVGVGSAACCQGSGPNWPQSTIALAEQAIVGLQCVGVGAAAAEPKFFGGYTSAQFNRASGQWKDFPEAEFNVPRILYRLFANHASLTLFASKSELSDAGMRERFLGQIRALASIDPDSGAKISAPGRNLATRSDNPTREHWSRQVADACHLLDHGKLEKVVLAREMSLQCGSQPDLQAVLQRLLRRGDGTLCFALRRGASTFLGATPERLVTKHGSEIVTEALAGSAAAGNSAALKSTLSDRKNQLEHSLVVREIVERLHGLGADVDVPERPQPRQFGPLVHLHTVLKARKLAAPHLLVLGERLHPTPAVGGVPLEQAVEFIRNHESFDRGRYASPVGWFDANGDGELAVALRSGLVRGREVRLFAGAGLVQGSEADAEWYETDLKLRSLFDALGLQVTSEPLEPALQGGL
jgi:menaquinone-specific isochorismate synthase